MTTARPGRIRIATYNLENLGGREDAAAAGRAERLRQRILRLEADVLCLQEVNAQQSAHHPRVLAALDRLIAGTPYESFSRFASTGPGGRQPADRQNLVLLSRFPIAAKQQIWNDLVPSLAYSPRTAVPADAPPVESRFERPILHATLRLPGGRALHVLDLHLKAALAAAIPGQKESAFVWKSIAGWAEGFFIASLKRAGQALEARLVVDSLFDADPHALVAVCGDFNADSHEVPVRIVAGDEDDTGNPKLAARVLAAAERNLPEERRFSVRHAGRPVMLDHILVSLALKERLSSVEIDNGDLRDEVFDAERVDAIESFHAPLMAEFALPA